MENLAASAFATLISHGSPDMSLVQHGNTINNKIIIARAKKFIKVFLLKSVCNNYALLVANL